MKYETLVAAVFLAVFLSVGCMSSKYHVKPISERDCLVVETPLPPLVSHPENWTDFEKNVYFIAIKGKFSRREILAASDVPENALIGVENPIGGFSMKGLFKPDSQFGFHSFSLVFVSGGQTRTTNVVHRVMAADEVDSISKEGVSPSIEHELRSKLERSSTSTPPEVLTFFVGISSPEGNRVIDLLRTFQPWNNRVRNPVLAHDMANFTGCFDSLSWSVLVHLDDPQIAEFFAGIYDIVGFSP